MKLDPCEVCGSNDWHEDAANGFLNCKDCGYTVEDDRKKTQAGGGFDEDTRAVPVGPEMMVWHVENNPLPDDIRMWMLLVDQKEDTESEWKKFRREASNIKKGLGIDTPGWKHNSSTKWWADARSALFFRIEVHKSTSGESSMEDISEELGQIADRDWRDELSHRVIRGSVVPERSLLSQDLERMTTPSRERIGIEFFIAMTEEEGGFWFLSDYASLIALNLRLVDRLLREHHPFSNVVIDRVKNIHNSRGITAAAVNGFAKKCARRLGIDPNGIEEGSGLPLEGVEEGIWELLGLGPVDSKTAESPHYWVPYQGPLEESPLNEEKKARRGGLRPVGTPIVMAHIPLAYVVAQRFFDSWRVDATWRNRAKKILDWIEEDLRWCPAEVSELDKWWEGIIAQERGDASGSVTRLR